MKNLITILCLCSLCFNYELITKDTIYINKHILQIREFYSTGEIKSQLDYRYGPIFELVGKTKIKFYLNGNPSFKSDSLFFTNPEFISVNTYRYYVNNKIEDHTYYNFKNNINIDSCYHYTRHSYHPNGVIKYESSDTKMEMDGKIDDFFYSRTKTYNLNGQINSYTHGVKSKLFEEIYEGERITYDIKGDTLRVHEIPHNYK